MDEEPFALALLLLCVVTAEAALLLALWMTLCIEGVGAALYLVVFLRTMPFLEALGMSVFHSISAFNNAGFDIFGRGDSAAAYAHDVWFNLVTCLLILLGGLGFFVMRELLRHRKGERFTLHTKVVLTMTAVLTAGGTLLVKLTEGGRLPWMGAFFASVTARTA